MPGTPVKVYTLSRFRVLRDGAPLEFPVKAQRKPLELLKVLVALGGEQVPAEQISDALWPDADGEAAHHNFASAVHRLRKLIGTEGLSLRDNRLSLVAPYCAVDALAFASAVGEAERAMARRDDEGVWEALQQALALYQGPFLEGEYSPPEILAARNRLHSQFLRHVGEGAKFFETADASERAITLLRCGLEVDGIAEEFAQSLMRIHAAQGRPAEALAVYQRLSDALRAAADAAPSAETEALRRSIAMAAGPRIAPEQAAGREAAPSKGSIPVTPAPADRAPRPARAFRLPTSWKRRPIALAAVAFAAALAAVAATIALRSRPEGEVPPPPVERPSIAVLPFANLSGDPEQEYFADGITDDIITDLSSLRGMLVIARESTFRYKGQPVDIRKVGQELNVRYVLEGSVRRSDGQVRISAQLIDTANSVHIWADRYDRPLTDIFAVQDEITAKIVEELEVSLVEGEQNRILRTSTRNPEAYDLTLKGRNHFLKMSKEDNNLARGQLEQALRLDPNYLGAMMFLAYTYAQDAMWDWNDARSHDESIRLAEILAERMIELDPSAGDAFTLLGTIHLLRYEFDEAVSAGEKGVELHPNSAKSNGLLAWFMCSAGRDAEGAARMDYALRLSPLPPAWMPSALAQCYLGIHRYEDALQLTEASIAQAPEWIEPLMFRIIALVRLKRMEEARASAREILRIDPGFDGAAFVRDGYPCKDPATPASWLKDLRAAGLH